MDIKWVPPAAGIYHIKWPAAPEWVFEWHSSQRKLWAINTSKTAIRNGQKVHEADCIAEHVSDHGMAIGFVQTWWRGYDEGRKAPLGILTTNQQALKQGT